MTTEMSLREHFSELRSRLIRIVIVIIVITVFSITFEIKDIHLNNNFLKEISTIYIPYPNPFNNFATQITEFMKETLLPKNVVLIQTAPGQAFYAQMNIGFLVGIIFTIPIIIKEIFGFIAPAIENKHRKKIRFVKIFLPISLLFISGIVFSYLLVVPFTLTFLYEYGQSIGIETFLNINEFISFVLQFLLGFGISFELPVVMYVISLTGLIDYNFWKKNFRYAILIFIIFGAVITPDGSGITMWFISGPMIALYVLGIIITKLKNR